MKQIGILNQAAQRTYLLRLLVKRNIRNQYYGSFIGVLWTVLNPLLNMLVMAFVFSQIFGRDGIELDYSVYVLSGNIIFNVMRASTSGSLPCLVNQRNLLQKNKISGQHLSHFPTSCLRWLRSVFLYRACAGHGHPHTDGGGRRFPLGNADDDRFASFASPVFSGDIFIFKHVICVFPRYSAYLFGIADVVDVPDAVILYRR